MSSNKCKNCGLANFAYDDVCRRCGISFAVKGKSKAMRPRRFSLSSLLIIAFVGGFAYYVYQGMQSSADEVYAGEMRRLAEQKKDKTAGLPRTEYDRQRAGSYGNALQSSNSFAGHNQHIEDTQKAMQAATNAQQGKQ
ncbi:MAG: hypothetical protein ACJ72Z_07430 [Pyrinomonadaceae bacterium]